MLELGTYRLTPEQCYQSVAWGLAQGLQRVDTAQLYRNEAEVGRVLKERDDSGASIFVTTKISARHLHSGCEAVLQSLETSLQQLGKVDQVLLHVPTDNWESIWSTLHMEVTPDRIPHFGVSNFPLEILSQLDPLPFSHQIELSPYCPRPKMVAWCLEQGIRVTAHSILGKGLLLKEPQVLAYAQQYQCTPTQALVAWTCSQGCSPVLRSACYDHIAEWSSYPRNIATPVVWSKERRVVTHPQFPAETEV